MPETAELILSLLILGAAIILTRQYHALKIKQAYLIILEDLKSKGALTPETAISLPYAKRHAFRFGLRDHRPTALKGLITGNIVGITEGGRYYLLDRRVISKMK